MCRWTNVRCSCGHDRRRLVARCAVHDAQPHMCRTSDRVVEGIREGAALCNGCLFADNEYVGATHPQRLEILCRDITDTRKFEFEELAQRTAQATMATAQSAKSALPREDSVPAELPPPQPSTCLAFLASQDGGAIVGQLNESSRKMGEGSVGKQDQYRARESERA